MGPRTRPPLLLLAFATLVLMPAGVVAQVPAGGEFRVNTYTFERQSSWARPATESDGDFVAVWASYAQDGGGVGVFGQRFAASGAARGSEFQVNTYTTGFQGEPAVGGGSRGNFVVVWTSEQNGSSIQGRRFDVSGSAVGGEFQVNVNTAQLQVRPLVGVAQDGSFVVSWLTGSVADADVAARRFDPSGNPMGGEFLVNTVTTGDQVPAGLSVDASGSFVVVWDGGGYCAGRCAVFGQRYDASGSRLGAEFQVNTNTAGTYIFRWPSVSVSPVGGFVVTWSDDYGAGIFARRFDVSGNPVGSEFLVNTYTTNGWPGAPGQKVVHDARGNFVITWTGSQDGSSDVFAQRFSASGARRGAEFRVNAYTTDEQVASSVSSDPSGNLVIDWNSRNQDGSGYGVFAQRFGGLHPRALAVDTAPGPFGDGNGVLEPGEGVNVVPRWQNLSGAPQTFGGTIDGISAPTGCIQVLLDETGNYGTVPDGATAFCIDCYRVLAWSAGRCRQHWDISMAERITPDTQGQVKAWALHVGESFTDVPDTSSFYKFVETLLHHDITGGCSATEYCPSGWTTREQMVVFVLLTKEGAGYAPPPCVPPNMFDDVPETSPFCRWVEEAARRGMAVGCSANPPLFCPQQPVTREQMSVLLLRTLDPTLNPPACVPGGERFADVPASSPFCRWIEELARRGVVGGCSTNPPLFCPASAVTREQMAVFLSVTFGLTLYGP